MKFRSNRLALIGVAAVFAAAAVSGCGGSDDSGELSKDDFIAQANEICADFNTQSGETEKEFTAAIQANDLEAAADAFVANAENMSGSVEQFADLTPPADDQETIEEFIDLSRQQVELANKVADALRDGDQETVQSVSEEASQLDEQSDTIADEYGLTECSGNGDSSDSGDESS